MPSFAQNALVGASLRVGVRAFPRAWRHALVHWRDWSVVLSGRFWRQQLLQYDDVRLETREDFIGV